MTGQPEHGYLTGGRGPFACWGPPQTHREPPYPDTDVQAAYLLMLHAAHVYQHAVRQFVRYAA